MPGRIALILTSPRCAPGLLSWPAWQAMSEAGVCFAADPGPGWQRALADAGVDVQDLGAWTVADRAARLIAAAGAGDPAGPAGSCDPADSDPADSGPAVTWLGSADGDPGLTDALAAQLARLSIGGPGAGEPPQLELIVGSHDVPGARLLDLVAVMDRLRSPGGCPWDAEQTHASLVPYLIEESHEVIEAIERPDDDPDRVAHLVEELGDLLLQVVFHARIGQENSDAPFGIDEVAGGIVEKLVRRHPHVFADVEVEDADEVNRNWEQIKAVEKQRATPFEGIPASLPSLARAQKLLRRLPDPDDPRWLAAADGEALATGLLEAVRQAQRDGVEAETVLRTALNRLVQRAP